MHCRRTRPWFSSTWAILARDGYLPHQFGHRGLRFAYSNGIVILGTLAILLVIIFSGRTRALIPLFAIGVFLCFTLSQTGMVRHWQRLHGSGWPAKLAINALGAVTAGSVTLIVVSTKFVEGAWIVLVLVPVLVASFCQHQCALRRHHHRCRHRCMDRSAGHAGERAIFAGVTREHQI